MQSIQNRYLFINWCKLYFLILITLPNFTLVIHTLWLHKDEDVCNCGVTVQISDYSDKYLRSVNLFHWLKLQFAPNRSQYLHWPGMSSPFCAIQSFI